MTTSIKLNKPSPRAWFSVFLLLVLARIPFHFNGMLQTDAFITWRCAKNLIETGVYGYNPGEASSAATSHLYVLLSAGLFKASGAYFFFAQLLLNASLLVAGLWLLSSALLQGWKQQRWAWALAALMPVSFQSSTMGMETALLIFLIGLLVWAQVRGGTQARLALVATFLLPWARPDAVAYGGLAFLWLWWRDKKLPYALGGALAAGALAMLAFNQFYFGQLLHQTIVGKSLCHNPSHSLSATLDSLREVFPGKNSFNPGIYSPFFTRFLVPLRWPIFGAALLVFGLAWARRKKAERSTMLLFITLALAPPLAYALGGIVYFWYLLPSANLANLIAFSWVGERWDSPWLRRSLLLTVLGLASLQWAHSFKEGGNERQMRDIGMDIAKLAKPTDTLYLEPAGTPVFYAGLYTWDSFGITSPLVTDYEKEHGSGWLMAFLKDKSPDLIFMVKGLPLETCGADLDEAWFKAHYDVKKEWVYDPAQYYNKELLTWNLVKHRDPLAYVLYGKRAKS